MAPSPCSSCAPLSPSQLQVGSRRARYPRGRLAFVGWARPAPAGGIPRRAFCNQVILASACSPKQGGQSNPGRATMRGVNAYVDLAFRQKRGKVSCTEGRGLRVFSSKVTFASPQQLSSVRCGLFNRTTFGALLFLRATYAYQNGCRRRQPGKITQGGTHCGGTPLRSAKLGIRILKCPTLTVT